MPTLEVHQLSASEVYRDIVRVNEAHRTDKRMERIKEGRVCLVRANGRECLAILRGHQDSSDAEIRMDDYTRGPDKLDLQVNHSYEFEFTQVRFLGTLRWAWNASEMGYQVASRIAIISFLMGLVGLVLGVDWHWVWSVVRSLTCHS